jgi:hypothetical protein
MKTTENTENEDLNEIEFEFPPVAPSIVEMPFVQVPKHQFEELINQLQTQKQELGILVGVFNQFQGFFKGKANAASMLLTITKLIKNKDLSASLENVFPILDKYNNG